MKFFGKKKPTKNRLEASKSIQNKEGVGFIPHTDVKSIPKGDAEVTEENRILGLPVTISTQRVKSITSKETVSNGALVLAKSRSEKGSQKAVDLTLTSH